MNNKSQAVVVTTTHRGVFFGYLEDSTDDTVTITQARMAVYWSRETHGVVGLAATGPAVGSKISEAAPRIRLMGVTAIFDATPDAAAAWERAPWT